MKHIFLYGPPGAGKLTVARCLASRYGVKVLDNTLTVGLALRLFEFGTKPYDTWLSAYGWTCSTPPAEPASTS